MDSKVNMTKILLLVFVIAGALSQPPDEIVVDITDNASIRGLIELVPNTVNPVYTFRGVPYAAPPVDDLRFAPTQPGEMWIGELDGRAFGVNCPQSSLTRIMGENCLFLNIWTPTLEPGRNLSTLVWIHGGSFQTGSGNYRGLELASMEDVIVVSINYRLGVLGFFTTGDGTAGGNYGLMDAQQAIRWLLAYVDRFGGDPNKITIFGESAGGMATSALILTPTSQGLFQRVISQSGTLTAPNRAVPWAVAASESRTVAESLGCPWTSTEAAVSCMRNLDWQDIIWHGTGILPYPTIDGSYIPDYPFSLYNSGEFLNLDYLIGCNKDEGYFFFYGTEPTRDNIRSLIYNHLSRYYTVNIDNMTDAVVREYVDYDNFTTDAQYAEAYSNVLGENNYIGPSNDVARKHSVRGNVFMYLFKHRPLFRDGAPSWVTATHGDEIPFVFGEPFSDSQRDFSENGESLSRQMMTYWANFAKTGNPNSGGLPTWPPVTCQNREYMELMHTPRASQAYADNRIRLWMDTIPALDTARNQYYRNFPWSCP